MDTSLTLIVIMAVLFACGVYAMLERSLTRVLIGFLLLGNAVNLLLLIVMGVPGRAPFYGVGADISDPLPQALTLTAIVITFAVSAFLLALIYRSWQLGQADTVEDDEADIALRERTDADEDLMDDESEADEAEATTDFVGVQTSPITVLHMRDHPAIVDDAPVDRVVREHPVSSAAGAAGGADAAGPGAGDAAGRGAADAADAVDAADASTEAAEELEETIDAGSPVLTAESAPPDDESSGSESDDDGSAEDETHGARDHGDPAVLRTDADTPAHDVDDTDAAEAHTDIAGDTGAPEGAEPASGSRPPTDRPDDRDEEERR